MYRGSPNKGWPGFKRLKLGLTVSEFDEFKPRLKSPKNRFQLRLKFKPRLKLFKFGLWILYFFLLLVLDNIFLSPIHSGYYTSFSSTFWMIYFFLLYNINPRYFSSFSSKFKDTKLYFFLLHALDIILLSPTRPGYYTFLS